MSASWRNVGDMFAVIDTETTGLKPTTSRVLEVGVVALDRSGAVEWEWSTLLDPKQDVGATHLHGVAQEDVIGAPTFAEISDTLTKLLSGRVLVAHNISFDGPMLREEFIRNSKPQLEQPWLCTAEQAKRQGFRPYRLDACCEALGISLVNAHTALGDARATAELFSRIFDLNSDQVKSVVDLAQQTIFEPSLMLDFGNSEPRLLSRDIWSKAPVLS